MAVNDVPLSDDDQRVLAELVGHLREMDGELEDNLRALTQAAQERQSMWRGRRDVLAGLAGGATGVAGLLAASGPAAAADTSTAELGAAGASWDLFVDEIKDPQGDPVVDIDDTGDLDWQRAFVDQTLNGTTTIAEVNNVVRQKSGESAQDAIDRAGAGDKIVLRPGTHSPIESGNGGQTIVGAGRGTTIAGSNVCVRISNNDVTVRDIEIDNTGSNDSTGDGILVSQSRCVVENVWVLQAARFAIRVGGNGNRVYGVWFHPTNVSDSEFKLNGDTNIVDDFINGTVDDQGTGNVTGDNA
jgi:hypothetical protein